jgi:hypothetical protein
VAMDGDGGEQKRAFIHILGSPSIFSCYFRMLEITSHVETDNLFMQDIR